MYVIKNISPVRLTLENDVVIEPGEQLDVAVLTTRMQDAADAGALQIRDATETPEERRADVEAIQPFHVGDPAIDGEK